MKRFPALVVFLVLFISCNNSAKSDPAADTRPAAEGEVRAHQCGEACTNGQHFYAHNEVGHTCSSDCGKPHQCGDKCSGDTHVYAHGEVSHYCLCVPGS